MKKLAVIAALGAAAMCAGTSITSAQCYYKRGSACKETAGSGWDSTCTTKCMVGIAASGKRMVFIYKKGVWRESKSSR
jgi:hypothetical protein